MAGLRQMRGKWYARVRYMKGVYQKEQIIPLKTSSKVEARERLSQVERLESDIKSGIDFSFPWMNDYGNVKVVHYSLDQAIDDYLQVRKLEGLREGTIEIYENALKGLVSTVGKNIPVNHITFQNIESMKKRLRSNLSSATLNMKLRAIKTFFNRLNENEQIDQNLKIKLVKTKKVYLPILLMKNGVKSKTLIYH
jgi:hypothetical protein